jgi:NADPH:quinone reductase-like Zn-dependent oxidoreductase
VRFEQQVSGMDVIFDTIGRDTLQRSWGVLKPGGRMVTIAADSEYATDERVKQAYFIVEPNHEQLVRIGGLLESGDLRPVVDTVMPIDQASAAFSGGVKKRRGRGKLVATLTPDT